jgi:acyl carrier protein
VHEQYLQNEAEFGKIFTDLAHMEVELASNGAADPAHPKRQVVQSLIDSLERIHDHQDATARVHEKYLSGQETFSRTFADLVQRQLSWYPAGDGQLKVTHTQVTRTNGGNGHRLPEVKPEPTAAALIISTPAAEPPAPVVSEAPVPAPAALGLDAAGIQPALLAVVSEKTGYPQEMLEMGMDMEADLGIDSIKRVEILGAMQERFPGFPAVDPAALSELHTLQQVLDHLGSATPAAPAPTAAPVVAAEIAAEVPAPSAAPAMEAAPAATGGNPEEVRAALLAVVSEKTGYPQEMLELEMDMEADLGIDSIKRVEILGAMQERFPGLPPVDPAALSELHTLQQVIQHLNNGTAAGKKA